MKYFSVVSDCLFYPFCIFLFSLAMLRFGGQPFAVSLTLSVLFAIGAGLLLALLLTGRSQKKQASVYAQKRIEALKLHLALEREEKLRALFLEAFTSNDLPSHAFEDDLKVDGVRHVLSFTLEPLSADACARLIKEYGNNFKLVTNSLSMEAEKLLTSFSVPFMTIGEVYALLEKTGTYPETLICEEVPKRSAWIFLRRAVRKSNARPFFVSGVLLLIMSLLSPFPVYYLTVGSILLLTSVSVRLFGIR